MMNSIYEAPSLEVLEVSVESGFAASTDVTMPDGGDNGSDSENWA